MMRRSPSQQRGSEAARRRRAFVPLVPCASLLVCLLLLACADFDAPPAPVLPDSAVAEPSFARDIEPVFGARCATAGCHTEVTHQAGLVLEHGLAYDAIVNRQSTLVPTLLRVAPGDPGNSLLVRIIGDDASLRLGLPRMPLGRPPLTDQQIANIVTWVTQGARRN
jgi:hypothetical protein